MMPYNGKDWKWMHRQTLMWICNWITLLHAWNTVNQLYFNFLKKKIILKWSTMHENVKMLIESSALCLRRDSLSLNQLDELTLNFSVSFITKRLSCKQLEPKRKAMHVLALKAGFPVWTETWAEERQGTFLQSVPLRGYGRFKWENYQWASPHIPKNIFLKT